MQEEWIQFHATTAKNRWQSTDERQRLWWISNHGRVKITNSWDDRCKWVNLSVTGGHTRTGRYQAIAINDACEKYVHRLVARFFIPNTYNKKTVNHIDGDKSNNHVSNLEWATYAEQMKHAWENRLNKKRK